MQKLSCRVPVNSAKEGNLRLDQAIAASPEAAINKLSRGLIRKMILAGAVYVNGKRLRIVSKIMRGGEIIDLYWNSKSDPAKTNVDKFLPIRVLYEDEAVVCVEKPAGLPTQPTLDEARANLFELTKTQLAKQAGKSIYLGMHHRLDRDTSGVVLFARQEKHNAHIGDLFKNHKASKLYVAVVHGKLKQSEGRLESYLAPVGKKGKRSKFGSVRSGGKKAITNYLVLDSTKSYSMIEVSIETGRTHQIRVHFSEMGHPIVGDTLYGSDEHHYEKLNRHLLHAHALSFQHPVTNGVVRVESPVPQEFRQWVSSRP